MQCISVDLPEPDGPMIAVSWPRAKSTLTPSRARTWASPCAVDLGRGRAAWRPRSGRRCEPAHPVSADPGRATADAVRCDSVDRRHLSALQRGRVRSCQRPGRPRHARDFRASGHGAGRSYASSRPGVCGHRRGRPADPLQRVVGRRRRRAAEGRAERLVVAPVAQPARARPPVARSRGPLDRGPQRLHLALGGQQVAPRRGRSAAPRRCPGRPAAAARAPARAAATAPARRTSSGTAPWPRTAAQGARPVL